MKSVETAYWTAFILGGFLLGSIMFSQLLPKLFLKKDITMLSSDHNPGATNVFAACGPAWGVACLGMDVLKGFIPVFLGYHLLNTNSILYAFVMAAPVIGHAVAPFNHFQGGKCIATSFGVMLGLFPVSHIGLLLAIIYIVFSTVLKINPNRIRSIAAFGLFGMISLIILLHNGKYSIAAGCMLISLIAIFKHSKFLAEKTYSEAA